MNLDFALRIDHSVLRSLRDFHFAPGKRKESLSYLFAHAESDAEGHRLLVPAGAPLFLLDDSCYERASGALVRLQADVLNGLLAQFASSGFTALVNCHDHPFGPPGFSAVDDCDDRQFDCYLRTAFTRSLHRMGYARSIYNVSLLLAGGQLLGRLTDVNRDTPFSPLTRTQVLGPRMELLTAHEPPEPDDARFARHAGFIDARAQTAIGQLRVGIVGCGGLGSILAESCVRVGFKSLTLVDADTLDASNLNRFQGGGPADIGQTKATLLARRLLSYAPDAQVTPVAAALSDRASLDALCRVDLLIGGVDDDVARYQLNHLALALCLPWFDAGVGIRTSEGEVDFLGRYFAVVPGVTGCLDCKGIELYDTEDVAHRLAHPTTRAARQRAGYVLDGPNIPAPSAYVVNQRAAAMLMQELLNWVCAWRPFCSFIGESWRATGPQRLDALNFADRPSDLCASCGCLLGRGLADDGRFPRERADTDTAWPGLDNSDATTGTVA